MKKGKKRFQPPKDIKQFWLAPHCGPGTLDPEEDCGFCGETHRTCAERASEAVRLHPEWNHDGSIMGDEYDDPEGEATCGGSGFWCSGCGRFWAMDTCGNYAPGCMLAADGAKQKVKGRKIYCVCGKRLATARPEESYQ